MEDPEYVAQVKLPRVAITFCTQCRWMLRAAYFGQELLSTFGTDIGEIALIPATGGRFTVNLTYKPLVVAGEEVQDQGVKEVLLWDYKVERCFPETKILKQKVRNCISPDKKLGHSDTPSSKAKKITPAADENTEVSSHSATPAPSVAGTDWSTSTLPVSSNTSIAPSTSRAAPNSPVPGSDAAGIQELTSMTDDLKLSKGSGKDACQDCA